MRLTRIWNITCFQGLERLLWALILIMAFSGLGQHLAFVFREVKKDYPENIKTIISLRAVDDVHFPMLAINVGGPSDPYGFVRHSKDMVGWDEISQEGKA